MLCMIPWVFKDIKLDHETVMSLDSWCISPYQACLPWDIKVCFNLFSIPIKYNMEDQHESASALTATGHRDSVIILFQVLLQLIFRSDWSPNHLETSKGSDHDEPQNFYF